MVNVFFSCFYGWKIPFLVYLLAALWYSVCGEGGRGIGSEFIRFIHVVAVLVMSVLENGLDWGQKHMNWITEGLESQKKF